MRKSNAELIACYDRAAAELRAAFVAVASSHEDSLAGQILDWLNDHPGAHTTAEIAAGLGTNKTQTSFAMTDLFREGMVARKVRRDDTRFEYWVPCMTDPKAASAVHPSQLRQPLGLPPKPPLTEADMAAGRRLAAGGWKSVSNRHKIVARVCVPPFDDFIEEPAAFPWALDMMRQEYDRIMASLYRCAPADCPVREERTLTPEEFAALKIAGGEAA